MSIPRLQAVRWGMAAAVGVTLASLAYAAWGPAGATDPRQGQVSVATGSQTAELIDDALRRFDGSLPPGYDQLLERAKRQLTEADVDDTFELGFAESLVLETWRCGWENAHVVAIDAGDKELAQSALGHLGDFYDLAYAKKHYDDPERAWETNVLRPARAGNSSPMRIEAKTCKQ